MKKRSTLVTAAFLTIFSLLIIFSGCSQAPETTATYDAQMAMADESFALLNQLNWAGYAQMMHPDALARFRAGVMPILEVMIVNTPGDSINVFGIKINSAEIQAMPPADFMVKIFNMVSELAPEIKSTFTDMQNQSLGAVAEGDSLLHVVVKTKMQVGTRNVNEWNVQTLRSFEGQWMLAISSKIEGVGLMVSEGLKQQLMSQGQGQGGR